MKIRNDTRAGLMALSLSLLLLPLVSLISEPAGADEFMKWERIPLQIPLQVGLERVVFVDKNVRVGFLRHSTVSCVCRAPVELST